MMIQVNGKKMTMDAATGRLAPLAEESELPEKPESDLVIVPAIDRLTEVQRYTEAIWGWSQDIPAEVLALIDELRDEAKKEFSKAWGVVTD